MKKKIALIGYRLNKGGAERVLTTLSIFFENQGIEVHNIIIIDDIGYPYSGKVFNLGKLKNEKNDFFNKIKRLVAIKKYLMQQNFDFIIDFRFRIKPLQEFLIARFIFNAKTIYTVHSSTLNGYISDFTPLAKLTYANCYKIVAITKAMQSMIEIKHGLKNVITIYNPLDIQGIVNNSEKSIDLNFEYIIGVGHFNTNQKQFDKLIYAYSKSSLPENKIALVILGEGLNKENLKRIAHENGVANWVHFLGFKTNPYKYIKRAKFFVLSSKFEGLPMVLLEALACCTPVVAFDCPTGPKEVVINEENGLLIEDQNIEALINGINVMTTNESLYLNCKRNAFKSVQKFSVEQIGRQWLKLMEIN
jgi:glycosyltransferase involved in cell wall biosynthesis